ncbi:unnamed protein product [marine sediment metagenome]|uniref:Uncharacterized protein n=1 Tax=marine sediment metagenome TaxID=412755 RepID=X1UV25_9ZZZZ
MATKVTRLTYDNYRFSIAMSHAADLNQMAVQFLPVKFVSYCLEHIQSPGGPAAGAGAYQNNRLAAMPELLPVGFRLVL